MGYNLIADLAERHTRVGRCILCGHGPGAATTPWGACKHCAPTPDGDRLLAAVRATDPRDAEIAALRAALGEQSLQTARLLTDVEQLTADLAAHKRALAAGPAALRRMAEDYDRKVILGTVAGYHQREAGIIRSADLINAAMHVEDAQEAAMKEKA